jgi:hypothetical protein
MLLGLRVKGKGLRVTVLAPKPRELNGYMVKWLNGYIPALGIGGLIKESGLNDKYHSPRIYSWVEFGARGTPNLIPRTSNLILHAISLRFVIITVSATVQISDFRIQISKLDNLPRSGNSAGALLCLKSLSQREVSDCL